MFVFFSFNSLNARAKKWEWVGREVVGGMGDFLDKIINVID
jgi:hypothetical protein